MAASFPAMSNTPLTPSSSPLPPPSTRPTPPRTTAGSTDLSASSAGTLLDPVLKGNSTLPDKSPSTRSPLFDLQSTDLFPSANLHKVASLRQLSSNFAQFNYLQRPLCSRKPLTRKEAG